MATSCYLLYYWSPSRSPTTATLIPDAQVPALKHDEAEIVISYGSVEYCHHLNSRETPPLQIRKWKLQKHKEVSSANYPALSTTVTSFRPVKDHRMDFPAHTRPNSLSRPSRHRYASPAAQSATKLCQSTCRS